MKKIRSRDTLVCLAEMLDLLSNGNGPMWQLIAFTRKLKPLHQALLIDWALEKRLLTMERSRSAGWLFNTTSLGRKLWQQAYDIDWSMYCGYTVESVEFGGPCAWLVKYYIFLPLSEDRNWVIERMNGWKIIWNTCPGVIECVPLDYAWN